MRRIGEEGGKGILGISIGTVSRHERNRSRG